MPARLIRSYQAHILDIERLTHFNSLLESPKAPIVILATNRRNSLVRGTTDILAPHSTPVDLLDREQIGEVVQLRANVQGLKLSPDVAQKLAEEGEKSSIRYDLQLLTPAYILPRRAERNQIELEDIGEKNELFLDTKTSAFLITDASNAS
ncbi:hypothetical protein CVT24_002995 [Panaeolus cyanescens]|uniref:RuvB-like helicase n=1 Tax=Panaeolus cyanescens TaxID=181874 RepID=A0A409YXW9_9AGAR|nr:hypothetical protein CVT24_002995 [Panaeolus cyanescens]